MAHGGLSAVLKRGGNSEPKSGAIGSRRIFAPHFKLQVLDSYRNDADCKGNQRATARKYGIHRRQIQKWLQVETNLRKSVDGKQAQFVNGSEMLALNTSRPLDDVESPLAPPFDPASPLDLSCKKSPSAPVPFTPPPPVLVPLSLATTMTSPDPDIWDLSTKKQSLKPVKIFKPYLEENFEECTSVVKEEKFGDCYCNNVKLSDCSNYNYTITELQPTFNYSYRYDYDLAASGYNTSNNRQIYFKFNCYYRDEDNKYNLNLSRPVHDLQQLHAVR